jgi:hypothetical protein
VLLDCEVAWYGEPAFDIAFLLNHFFLKSLLLAPRDVCLRQVIEKFWFEYQNIRPTPEIEPRAGWLLLMLMLARVDGKSPVEYLDTPRQQFIRDFVSAELPKENFSLRHIVDKWFNELGVFK